MDGPYSCHRLIHAIYWGLFNCLGQAVYDYERSFQATSEAPAKDSNRLPQQLGPLDFLGCLSAAGITANPHEQSTRRMSVRFRYHEQKSYYCITESSSITSANFLFLARSALPFAPFVPNKPLTPWTFFSFTASTPRVVRSSAPEPA